ncbi:hypothetical protein AVEN_130733-1 [Araneus ventricosus]|uniref:Uncharacterized protein n=1 Tax=Araneus ventricosus TaxID=182803 RepID=A0A4Y2MZS0_ARAVE|nr:hypothetical protein AVEN_130733-1 [Araneus ventricosus]
MQLLHTACLLSMPGREAVSRAFQSVTAVGQGDPASTLTRHSIGGLGAKPTQIERTVALVIATPKSKLPLKRGDILRLGGYGWYGSEDGLLLPWSVVCSRVSSSDCLVILQPEGKTANVVYKEVFNLSDAI